MGNILVSFNQKVIVALNKLRLIPLFFLIGICFSLNGFAQYIRISGTIRDSLTQAPLVSCSVRAVNIRRGAVTDSAGYYSFIVEESIDSIKIMMMGYQTVVKPIGKKTSQEINLQLQTVANNLADVTVYPTGYDPAVQLFKKILKHKSDNHNRNVSSLQYELYEKLELDANNISEKVRQSRLMKPFSFVFDHTDSANNKEKRIPVFLTESIADYYYQKDPKIEKTIVRAKQLTGIKNESMLQYLDDLKQKVDIYENYPVFFKVIFISPLADNGLNYYQYTIEERKIINGRKYFRLSFHPLRTGTNTFSGECWVIDKTYAITAITMQMEKTANINWVGNILISQEFTMMADSVMIVNKDELSIQFLTLSDKTPGFIGKKTSYYRNMLFNKPIDEEAVNASALMAEQAGALKKDNTYWNLNRFVPLTQNEKWAYTMVDSIRKVPAFAAYSKIVSALGTGYYAVGKVDIGNIYKIFTANPVEGGRYNVGLRTNNSFSNRIQLKAYAGMGVKRQKIKYGISAMLVLNQTQWENIQLKYQDDYASLSDHMNELNENSLFGSLLRRTTARDKIKLINTRAFSIQYEKYYANGFSFQFTGDKRILSPAFNMYYTSGKFKPIFPDSPGYGPGEYSVTEAALSVRYAYKEKQVITHFNRVSLGSKYPIIELRYTKGIPINDGLLKSDFNYHKYAVSISQQLNIAPFGSLSYIIDGSITNGVLPLALLNVAKGNDTYYYNRYAFNNMNRYEFVSDRFAAVMIEHRWGSFPFNRLPLIKKLNWRSVTSFRALTGSMSSANRAANKSNENANSYHFTVPDKTPYMEAGFGVENIFHVLRIDAIWRLSYKDKPGATNFGLRAAFQFSF